MKAAKEILEELKAREELMARGWTEVICDQCKGAGWRCLPIMGVDECFFCDGTGTLGWRAPEKQKAETK